MSIRHARAFIERLKNDTDFRAKVAKAGREPALGKEAITRLVKTEGFEFDDHDMCEARKQVVAEMLTNIPDTKEGIREATRNLSDSLEILALEARICGGHPDSGVCAIDAQR